MDGPGGPQPHFLVIGGVPAGGMSCPAVCVSQGDALVLCYLTHARSKLQRHSLATGEHVGDVPLPGVGSVREFSGRRKDAEAFFLYTDFAVPGAIYRQAPLRAAAPASPDSLAAGSRPVIEQHGTTGCHCCCTINGRCYCCLPTSLLTAPYAFDAANLDIATCRLKRAVPARSCFACSAQGIRWRRFDATQPGSQPQLFREAKLKADFSPEQLESRQVFVSSPDGTKVPMFIVCKKGTELNGQNPTLLYGYGGGAPWPA